MEVFLSRKLSNDGFKDEYYRDVKSVYCWENKSKLVVHIIDSAEEGSIIFDVIKFEVY